MAKMINILMIRKTSDKSLTVLEKFNITFEMVVGGAGLILASVLAVPTFSGWMNAQAEKEYHGIWYSDYTDVFDNGLSCNQKSTTQLFEQHKYAYSGTITCTRDMNNGAFEAVYNFRAGGIWSLNNNSLTFEIVDVNSTQLHASLGGVIIPRIPNYKASDDVTKHTPFSFEVLDKQKDQIMVQKVAPGGGYTKIELLRSESPYIPKFSSVDS